MSWLIADSGEEDSDLQVENKDDGDEENSSWITSEEEASDKADDDEDSDEQVGDEDDADEANSDEDVQPPLFFNRSTNPSPDAATTAFASTNDRGASSKVFTLFPRLPTELRLKIWKDACFEPRLIDLWFVPVELNQSINFDETAQPFVFRSHSRGVPSILHTSQEARIVGLQNYSLDFDTAFEGELAHIPGHVTGGTSIEITAPPQIYVNWSCDIICPMPTLLSPVNDIDDNDEQEEQEEYNSCSFWTYLWYHYPELQRVAVPADLWEDAEVLVYEHNLQEVFLYKYPKGLENLCVDDLDLQKPILQELATIEGRLGMSVIEAEEAKESLEEALKYTLEHPNKVPKDAVIRTTEGWKIPDITASLLRVTLPG